MGCNGRKAREPWSNDWFSNWVYKRASWNVWLSKNWFWVNKKTL